MDHTERLKAGLLVKNKPVRFVKEVLDIPLFPKQEEILLNFYSNEYKQLNIAAGMRGGKSTLGGIFTVIEFTQLMVMKNPQKFYGLLPSSNIFNTIISASSEQANDSIFGSVKDIIRNSDFYQPYLDENDLIIKESKVRCESKNLEIKALSSWANTLVGRTAKSVCLDEVAMFEQTVGKRGAWKVYTLAKKSTDTFALNGHVCVISSPQHPSDVIMSLVKRDDKYSLNYKVPTWEMNPHYSEKQLREEYKYDMASFYRDFACEPSTASGQVFPNGINFNDEIVNVLTSNKIDETKIRIMAIDPAIKGDKFGVSTAYIDWRTGKIVVDGVTSFTKDDGSPYMSSEYIKSFLLDRIKLLNVNTLIFDVWMFPGIIEAVDGMGIHTEKHIVRKDDYDRLRELSDSKLLEVTFDDVLKHEIDDLYYVNEKRVDHPQSNSKDLSDCVANCAWWFSDPENRNIGTVPPTIVVF